MKKERKILSLLLILCLVLSFAACGSKGMSDEEIMQKSVENMQALNSLTAESVVEMVFSAGGETMNMTTEMVQRMINEPLALEQTMTMTMGGEAEELQSAVYLEADGDNLITYTQMEGKWYKTTQSGFEALKAYDSTGAMALYMEAMENFKKVGTEKVAGVKTNKYEGVIPEEYFQSILEASGMDKQLGLQGAGEETLANLFKGMGEMPITIWIDGEKLLPVKYDYDMSAMMKAIMSSMGMGEDELSIDKVTMSMIITGYDNVDEIVIPQEARDAEELAS